MVKGAKQLSESGKSRRGIGEETWTAGDEGQAQQLLMSSGLATTVDSTTTGRMSMRRNGWGQEGVK